MPRYNPSALGISRVHRTPPSPPSIHNLVGHHPSYYPNVRSRGNPVPDIPTRTCDVDLDGWMERQSARERERMRKLGGGVI